MLQAITNYLVEEMRMADVDRQISVSYFLTLIMAPREERMEKELFKKNVQILDSSSAECFITFATELLEKMKKQMRSTYSDEHIEGMII